MILFDVVQNETRHAYTKHAGGKDEDMLRHAGRGDAVQWKKLILENNSEKRQR